MAHRIASSEAEVPTGVATVVVTISHYRSGDLSVRFGPATDRSGDGSVPSSLNAYLVPGASEGGRSWIRHWRTPLVGTLSSEPVAGQVDTNLVRHRHWVSQTLGVLRRRRTAVVVAAAAAIAVLVFMLSPVSSPGASDPTAPASPEAEISAMSNTNPADCTYLAASGLMSGLYGRGAEALSALALSGLAGESPFICVSPG